MILFNDIKKDYWKFILLDCINLKEQINLLVLEKGIIIYFLFYINQFKLKYDFILIN